MRTRSTQRTTRVPVRILSNALCLLMAACSSSPPPPSVHDFLPALPATGGAALAAAGLVTDANRAAEIPAGPASKGLPGDYYLRNDKVRLLIQAPGRFAETLGFGGNPINLDFVRGAAEPAGTQSGRTQFGELGPFLNDSHTANFTRIEIVRDRPRRRHW